MQSQELGVFPSAQTLCVPGHPKGRNLPIFPREGHLDSIAEKALVHSNAIIMSTHPTSVGTTQHRHTPHFVLITEPRESLLFCGQPDSGPGDGPSLGTQGTAVTLSPGLRASNQLHGRCLLHTRLLKAKKSSGKCCCGWGQRAQVAGAREADRSPRSPLGTTRPSG